MISIDLNKGTLGISNETARNDRLQDMQMALIRLFDYLQVRHDRFDAGKAFTELHGYISTYDRIMYSQISNIIFRLSDDDQPEVLGTIMSNLEELVTYSSDSNVIEDRKLQFDSNTVDDTCKSVLKIWDHVNLANQQYRVLKQSDTEYSEKFEKSITQYKEEITRDMTARLLTLVSIFTALAFLVFGSISSFGNIMSVENGSLFKVLASGIIWGLCTLNLIFVFLYCVSVLTRMGFGISEGSRATVFQKYPIVWWCNYILVSLLVICLWAQFMLGTKIGLCIIDLCNNYGKWVLVIGTVMVVALIIAVGKRLFQTTSIDYNS